MAELLEDLADLFPFTGIVNIGYIKGKDSLFICSLDGIFQHVKHIFNIFRRQAESCRIMGRRVDDDKDTVLFLEKLLYFFPKSFQIEPVVFCHHGIGVKIAVHIAAHGLVRAPIPSACKHRITRHRVVPDAVMDGTAAPAVATAAV